MRRLLLLLALLALPSVAKADDWPTFYGCDPVGCIQVTLSPYQPNQSPDRYLYDLTCTSGQDCGAWLFERVLLFDSSGASVYARGRGNPGGLLSGTPTTGTMTFSTLDAASGLTTPHTVVLTTTPEPVTMALMSTGLVVIGAVRRRRR